MTHRKTMRDAVAIVRWHRRDQITELFDIPLFLSTAVLWTATALFRTPNVFHVLRNRRRVLASANRAERSEIYVLMSKARGPNAPVY